MHILVVKLSSLGDIVHAIPVVHDIRTAFPGALIDWVVEPAFAPLVRRVEGVDQVIECALRRWRTAWWTTAVRTEWRAFKARLQATRYDAVLDLQGLTKSALIARLAKGTSHGLANRTEGSSYERPAAWLIDDAIHVAPRTHALDRSRLLASVALGYRPVGPPRFGIRARAAAAGAVPEVVLVHGTSRADKLWPEAAWIEFGGRVVDFGWHIALPHSGAVEFARAQRIAERFGAAAKVWPETGLDALVDRLAQAHGVVGVDSGLSHMAVALDLPHVQIYNWPTAWRTGPQASHGHLHQVSVEAGSHRAPPTPPHVDAVWNAWCQVREAVA